MSGMTRRQFLQASAAAQAAHLAPAGAAGPGGEEDARMLTFRREVPVRASVDVVVCGGGPAGVAAALAARRAGLEVLVVEGQGQLCGTCTSGLVSHWLGGRTSDCRQWVVGGLFRSMSAEAAKEGFALLPTPPASKYQPHGWYKGQLAAGVPFDPFAMAAYLDDRAAAAGVEVLLATQAVDVEVEARRITHVVIFSKSGMAAVPAGVVVDATGDADMAARGGCRIVKGRDSDGLMAPASLTFHVDGVDQAALSAYIHARDCPRFRRKIAELRQAGVWTFPYEIFISVQLQEPGTMMINTTRLVGIDGTDGASVARGLARGRAEVRRLMAILREHFPGFGAARLKAVAPMLGVRETRRIRGPYVLKVADLAEGKRFADTIGFSAYGWDLPNPKRPSDNPGHGRIKGLTPIPYRIMLPQPIENLICPGRAVSVERPVLGPLRVMAPCMAMGEAAGVAAALAVRGKKAFADVDPAALRTELKRHGAVVDWP